MATRTNHTKSQCWPTKTKLPHGPRALHKDFACGSSLQHNCGPLCKQPTASSLASITNARTPPLLGRLRFVGLESQGLSKRQRQLHPVRPLALCPASQPYRRHLYRPAWCGRAALHARGNCTGRDADLNAQRPLPRKHSFRLALLRSQSSGNDLGGC